VFRRFAVMRHWVTSGQHKMEDIISRDQLHMNDASYNCIARLLADSLASAALATPPPQTDDPITTGSELRAGMPTTRKPAPSPQVQHLPELLGPPE
jgi:hypothetical protein